MSEEEDRLKHLDADIRELLESRYLYVDEDGRFRVSLAGRLVMDTRRPSR